MCDKKKMWNSAGKAGLILGAVSILYFFVSQWLAGMSAGKATSAFLISVLNFLVWAAKFAGCIILMRLFMKKFAAGEEQADNSDTFKWGMATAFLSALVYSAAYLAYVLFISPEVFEESFDLIMQNYSSMLDSNSIDAIDALKDRMPTLSFFGNLIYCFLFGTILSAILSRNIPSRNPFDKK